MSNTISIDDLINILNDYKNGKASRGSYNSYTPSLTNYGDSNSGEEKSFSEKEKHYDLAMARRRGNYLEEGIIKFSFKR